MGLTISNVIWGGYKMRKLLAIMLFLIVALATSTYANPVLSSIGAQTVNENEVLTFNATCTDPDNGSTAWIDNSSLVTLSNTNNTFATVTINPGYDDAGVYNVNITINDVNSTSVQEFALTVNNVNRAPTITSSAVTTGAVAALYQYDIDATDADGDNVTYSIITNPDPTNMTINTTSGLVEWTPSATGTYNVVVGASDGTNTTNQSFAITVSPPSQSISIQLATIALGSQSQERSNPQEDVLERVSTTFVIENTGSLTINDVNLTHNVNTDYNVSFENIPTTLTSGQTHTVTIRATVPISHDAITSNFLTDINIGTISLTGNTTNGTVQDTASLTMEAENNLIVEDVDVVVDNGASEDVDDGDRIDDIKPGDEIEVQVEIENTFPDTDKFDFDIEDIELRIEIDDRDFDVDEDEDLSDLRAEDSTTEEISFDVDEDADEATYNMIITVDGEDENGARHGEKITIDLKVERNNHEIIVRDFSLSPSTVTCNRRSTLRVRLLNAGKDDEDEVALSVDSNDLNIHEKIRNIKLDEDDDISKSFEVNVPSSKKSGDYIIEIKSYYNNNVATDHEIVTLRVNTCTADATYTTTTVPTTTIEIPTPPTGGTDDTVVVVSGGDDSGIPTQPTGTVPDVGPTSQRRDSFRDSGLYLGLLIILILIIIGAGGFLLFSLTHQKKYY